MKNNIISYLIISFVVLLPINVKAICSNADKSNLRSLASNINYTYDYVQNNNDVTFNITFTNVQSVFKIKDSSSKNFYQDLGSEFTLSGYRPGENYRFDVYTKDETCTTNKLISIYITLPYYNSFYSNELCKGIEDYELCQKWFKNSYSYDETLKKVKAYINSKTAPDNENQDEVQEEPMGIYDYIILFYLKSYFIVLPIIIIVCIFAMYKISKKNKLI